MSIHRSEPSLGHELLQLLVSGFGLWLVWSYSHSWAAIAGALLSGASVRRPA